jgi:hypothetical protein
LLDEALDECELLAEVEALVWLAEEDAEDDLLDEALEECELEAEVEALVWLAELDADVLADELWLVDADVVKTGPSCWYRTGDGSPLYQ